MMEVLEAKLKKEKSCSSDVQEVCQIQMAKARKLQLQVKLKYIIKTCTMLSHESERNLSKGREKEGIVLIRIWLGLGYIRLMSIEVIFVTLKLIIVDINLMFCSGYL